MTSNATPNTSDPRSWANGSIETPDTPTVYVCMHRSCRERGAAETLQAFAEKVPDGVCAAASTCMGQCSSGPTVRVSADEMWYYGIKPEDVDAIVEQHIVGGEPIASKLNPRLHRYYR
ncbi:MAG: ferredoxin [Geitlerinemataceae cyanobacterium]